MTKQFTLTLLSVAAALGACTVLPLTGGGSPEGSLQVRFQSPVKQSFLDGIEGMGASEDSHFQTKGYDPFYAYSAKLTVKAPLGLLTTYKYNPVPLSGGQSGNMAYGLPVPNTNAATYSFPVLGGKQNYVLKADAVGPGGLAMPPWMSVAAVVPTVTAGAVTPITVNWNTTPAARIVEKITALGGGAIANSLNVAALQAMIETMTLPSTMDGFNYDFAGDHPSRIDVVKLATWIKSDGGAIPAPSPSWVLPPATIAGKVSGRYRDLQVMVYSNDPTQAPVLTNPDGTFTMPNVSPVGPVTLRVISPFHEPKEQAVTVYPGKTTAANITLTNMNYMPYAVKSGLIIRYSTTTPIKVQIVRPAGLSAPSFVQDNEDAVTEALNFYQTFLTDQGVTFNVLPPITEGDVGQAAAEANADIFFKWQELFTDGKLGYAQLIDPISVPVPLPIPRPFSTQLRTFVNLGVKTKTGVTLNASQNRALAFHEIGHALGIWNGHSPNIDDIMYYQAAPPGKEITVAPNRRDLNTLRYLYSITPDVVQD